MYGCSQQLVIGPIRANLHGQLVALPKLEAIGHFRLQVVHPDLALLLVHAVLFQVDPVVLVVREVLIEHGVVADHGWV